MEHPSQGLTHQVIGVDLAGADADQVSLFAACQEAALKAPFPLRCYSSVPLQGSACPNIEWMVCPDVISMQDEALSAIRKKKNSSLVRAMLDLKAGAIAALVTCANTGAVTAAAVVHLKRFSGLHHPALVAELPLPYGRVVALDMGAFVEASGKDLFSYANLGSAYASSCYGVGRPRVGLLNIGREASRGTAELRQADRYLSLATTMEWEYVGNVEPADVFSGAVDVLVTSGFAGNIFLKTAEAVVQLSRSSSLPYKPSGALLVGVNGVVVKCHGSSSKEALAAAIAQARTAAHDEIVHRVEQAFSLSQSFSVL